MTFVNLTISCPLATCDKCGVTASIRPLALRLAAPVPPMLVDFEVKVDDSDAAWTVVAADRPAGWIAGPLAHHSSRAQSRGEDPRQGLCETCAEEWHVSAKTFIIEAPASATAPYAMTASAESDAVVGSRHVSAPDRPATGMQPALGGVVRVGVSKMSTIHASHSMVTNTSSIPIRSSQIVNETMLISQPQKPAVPEPPKVKERKKFVLRERPPSKGSLHRAILNPSHIGAPGMSPNKYAVGTLPEVIRPTGTAAIPTGAAETVKVTAVAQPRSVPYAAPFRGQPIPMNASFSPKSTTTVMHVRPTSAAIPPPAAGNQLPVFVAEAVDAGVEMGAFELASPAVQETGIDPNGSSLRDVIAATPARVD